MEDMVTLKLETYDNMVDNLRNLNYENEKLQQELVALKETLNKLAKTLIEETKYCDFDGATVEEIKSKNPSGYIYCSTYRSLINVYTDDEIKAMLIELKEQEQDDEKDN